MIFLPALINPYQSSKKLSRELAKLSVAKELYHSLANLEQELAANRQMLSNEQDPPMREMIKEEIDKLSQQLADQQKAAQIELLPKDHNDDQDAIIEIRAGTGGDEAGLFVGDISRMYRKYCELQRFQVDLLHSSANLVGGFKEMVMQVEGREAYRKFKHEAGTHRVQRVPDTETQGRIHTSTVTIAVLPASEEVAEVVINPSEIKVDTYRSQGAGGQHVNTTDSAVRITHLPTGIVVTCQKERSQLKNRARALDYLKAKIYDQEIAGRKKNEADLRRSMVGSGDRSERIRTYNYPQGRISDHRLGLTIYRLEAIMQNGDITELVDALLLKEQLLKLENLHMEVKD